MSPFSSCLQNYLVEKGHFLGRKLQLEQHLTTGCNLYVDNPKHESARMKFMTYARRKKNHNGVSHSCLQYSL